MNFEFSDEQKQLQEGVERFVHRGPHRLQLELEVSGVVQEVRKVEGDQVINREQFKSWEWVGGPGHLVGGDEGIEVVGWVGHGRALSRGPFCVHGHLICGRLRAWWAGGLVLAPLSNRALRCIPHLGAFFVGVAPATIGVTPARVNRVTVTRCAG